MVSSDPPFFIFSYFHIVQKSFCGHSNSFMLKVGWTSDSSSLLFPCSINYMGVCHSG
uniref:Uncharacterized protein n=1 Tax=Oryza glumipatula TaxID=40148 RepID=A0A0E0AS00_9ORYZ